ncbi:DUF6127 family protein [Sedimentitalea sp. JM2-8]|uniref:DUF6127 family protein n=1 Tax=Sedimentitalea xiamensis TaxID=3050037 RepID=A0ABT7FJS7_9RHOB|nr:DUF6127 family protein [Sedimentitalea xiamensis]MDK3075285.1 DUF6127 family protein [Sedimentitalea xiamensis]
MPDAEFEAILARATEEGAKRALADVGLDSDEAALDLRDLRRGRVAECDEFPIQRTRVITTLKIRTGTESGRVTIILTLAR